jgi:hypothetical protein
MRQTFQHPTYPADKTLALQVTKEISMSKVIFSNGTNKLFHNVKYLDAFISLEKKLIFFLNFNPLAIQ